jgi:hypothetical protein
MDPTVKCIDQLACLVEHEPSEIRIWTVASLASSVGVQAHLTTIGDPVEALVELGDLWVLAVAELLEDCPSRRPEVLRAAQRVVRGLLTRVADSAP